VVLECCENQTGNVKMRRRCMIVQKITWLWGRINNASKSHLVEGMLKFIPGPTYTGRRSRGASSAFTEKL
jgi:hypothetical protein